MPQPRGFPLTVRYIINMFFLPFTANYNRRRSPCQVRSLYGRSRGECRSCSPDPHRHVLQLPPPLSLPRRRQLNKSLTFLRKKPHRRPQRPAARHRSESACVSSSAPTALRLHPATRCSSSATFSPHPLHLRPASAPHFTALSTTRQGRYRAASR